MFNYLGELLFTALDKEHSSGQYNVNVDMSDYASGTYIYQIQTDIRSISKKMILLK